MCANATTTTFSYVSYTKTPRSLALRHNGFFRWQDFRRKPRRRRTKSRAAGTLFGTRGTIWVRTDTRFCRYYYYIIGVVIVAARPTTLRLANLLSRHGVRRARAKRRRNNVRRVLIANDFPGGAWTVIASPLRAVREPEIRGDTVPIRTVRLLVVGAVKIFGTPRR